MTGNLIPFTVADDVHEQILNPGGKGYLVVQVAGRVERVYPVTVGALGPEVHTTTDVVVDRWDGDGAWAEGRRAADGDEWVDLFATWGGDDSVALDRDDVTGLRDYLTAWLNRTAP